MKTSRLFFCLLALVTFSAKAQVLEIQAGDTISGILRDKDGPMMMVNVKERNADGRVVAQAITDSNGRFFFPSPKSENRIQVKYAGFETVDLPIDKNFFEINMKDEEPAVEIMPENFRLHRAAESNTQNNANPALSQRTDEHLKTSDYIGKRPEIKIVQVDISDLASLADRPKTVRKDVCWGQKVSSSFEESYEIQCRYNPESKTFRLELTVQNQDKPLTLEIDSELAYQIGTLFDAAVLSASNLPDREWMRQLTDALEGNPGSLLMAAGLDGTTYNFFNFKYGAQCWSPYGGNNKELVSIGTALHDAVAQQNIEPVRAMLPRIKSLAESYASQLQDPFRKYFMLRLEKAPNDGWSWWRDIP